jgi:uncharacterized protein
MTRRGIIVQTPHRGMGEMDDDLHRPLGRDRDQDGAPWFFRINPPRVAAAILALAVAVLAALFFLAPRGPLDATLGGKPYALTRIEPYAAPPPEPAAKLAEAGMALDAPAGSSVQVRSAVEHSAEVEVQNGVRVLRAGGGGGANPLIIQVEPTTRLAPAPDKRLVEKSRFGAHPMHVAH